MKTSSTRHWVLCFIIAAFLGTGGRESFALDIYVSPHGNDAQAGTEKKPLATLQAAQKKARLEAGRQPVRVILRAGTYYLGETLHFTSEDSGTSQFPVSYAATEGEQVVVSGGQRLQLRWTRYREGMFQARIPSGLAMDQLFVNGKRMDMARYPNFDPNAEKFGGTADDAISPQRVARWQNPTGGFIHAMHEALWGDMHWIILGKNVDGTLNYEGGWQNNRPSPMHKNFRFVENIREELDAPGEWFYDAQNGVLYFYPPEGVNLNSAVIESVQLAHLMEFRGSMDHPVRFLSLEGLTFHHAARTFMQNKEPLLRTDWTIYRGGALLLEGCEDLAISDCNFEQLGGNAVFVNNYNRRVTVKGCEISENGANGVAFVGDPTAARNAINWKGHNDYTNIDKLAGPLHENYPADCLVEDCLIQRCGRFEKQTAAVEIDLARNITVRHCSIYDMPRAGLNIGDGCWGGHVVEYCDIFDTVKETGDHGSFNSWGRDRFWSLAGAPAGELINLAQLDIVKPNTLRNNRWRCDHGWDVDLDDGSSRYLIYNNLLLHGGLKLREGFLRVATNNIIVGNSLHPHVWFPNSGDIFARNIVMGAYRPAIMDVAQWGAEVDHNLFTTSEADRDQFRSKGCDADSLVGDAMFVDPASGDFRVKEGSPALRLGFVNFPMNEFGVQSPRLKSKARTPEIPDLHRVDPATFRVPTAKWLGAQVRELEGEEYSSIGVPKDAGGIYLVEVPAKSDAFKAGLRKFDFIDRIDEHSLKGLKDFLSILGKAGGGTHSKLLLHRKGQEVIVTLSPVK